LRDYATLKPRFWIQGTGKRLRGMAPPSPRELALYLMSAPGSNMLGLYYLPIETIRYEVGYETLEGAREGLRRVCETGFAHYSEETEEVFVVNMAHEQLAEELVTKDNRHSGVKKELKKLRKCPLYGLFLERYAEPYNLQDLLAEEQNRKALASPYQAPSKPGSGTGSGTGTRAVDPPLPPEGAGVGSDGSKPADPTETEPDEPVTGVQPARHPSSSASAEVNQAFKFVWDQAHEADPKHIGKSMPRFLPSVWENAVEHCRDIARDNKRSLYQAACDVAKAAVPGSANWHFTCTKVDPYVTPMPAQQPRNGRVQRAPPTTEADFRDVEPLDVQLARIGRTS
jgi:hypothetical protein